MVYGKRYWYPHLQPKDIALWERFIEQNPDAYDFVQYDVCVGDDPEFETEMPGMEEGEEWKLYQKKIDVVGFKQEQIDIIELKPRAKASAVGQVKLYKKLYKRDYKPPTGPMAIIITDEMAKDVKEFANEEGVEVIIV